MEHQHPKADIVMIGGGNMGMAMVDSLLGQTDQKIIVKTPDPQTAKNKLSAHRQCHANLAFSDHFSDIAINAGAIVIFAVKPQILPMVLQEAYSFLEGLHPVNVVSVAAGIAYDTLRDGVPSQHHCVRAMPNLAVAKGAGLMGYYAPVPCKAIEQSLKVFGDILYLEHEHMLHAFTAVAGSGPAYFFYLTQCLAQAAKQAGFSPQIAEILARGTLVGSGALLQGSPLSPQTWREHVTSKGGTTAAGLSVLMGAIGENSTLQDIFEQTIACATQRSIDLGKITTPSS